MIKALQAIYILITCLPQIISIVRKVVELIDSESSKRGKVKQLNSALEKAKRADTRELEDLFKIKRSKPIKIGLNVALKQHGLLSAKTKRYGFNLTDQKKKYSLSLIKQKPQEIAIARKFDFSGVRAFFKSTPIKMSIDLTSLRNAMLGEIYITRHPKVYPMPANMFGNSRDHRMDGTFHYDDAATISAGKVPFTAHMGRHGRMKSGIIPS